MIGGKLLIKEGATEIILLSLNSLSRITLEKTNGLLLMW